MDIRLIGFDLDGTLLRDHNTIDEYTLGMLKRARDMGIWLVVITGRPYSGIPEGLKALGLMDYYITTNGAQITASEGEKRIFSNQMTADKAIEITERLSGLDCMLEVFTSDYGHIEKRLDDYYEKNYRGTVLEDYIFSSRRVVESIDSMLRGLDTGCDEIFIICRDNEVREQIYSLCGSIEGIQLGRLGDRFVEITSKGTNKGTALCRLCEHLGISPEDTVAFGDGENDLQFMEMAGTAVAMENGCDIIKKKADIIAPSNEAQGVGIILNELLK